MANLRLLPCDPSDAAEILAEQFAAFSSPKEPCFFIGFPETEERERAVKRMLDWWMGDESAKYMKAVDVDTGAIVSAAKWCIYDKPLTDEQLHAKLHVDWHPDADILDVMSTHPAHQHRGAGSMLVKWGTDIADSMGVDSFIEGTITARPLYEKNGFVVSPNKWIVIPVPDKWKSRPEIKFFFYERPAKSPLPNTKS
ncbi:hypothetical protein LOCC1_G002909 [Lachnellula occidentalis]|uniref:N-acetyltransferase domain-containing protein n=1 Tax=Lachnellula occidentalis TaxID=215460 RepID=A0A8H8S2H9_9HELO|nr:hypothetical protein LOCC1_G002909 [Lachnellula occidentalis]